MSVIGMLRQLTVQHRRNLDLQNATPKLYFKREAHAILKRTLVCAANRHFRLGIAFRPLAAHSDPKHLFRRSAVARNCDDRCGLVGMDQKPKG